MGAMIATDEEYPGIALPQSPQRAASAEGVSLFMIAKNLMSIRPEARDRMCWMKTSRHAGKLAEDLGDRTGQRSRCARLICKLAIVECRHEERSAWLHHIYQSERNNFRPAFDAAEAFE